MALPDTQSMAFAYDGESFVTFFANTGSAYVYDGESFWLGDGSSSVLYTEAVPIYTDTNVFQRITQSIEEVVEKTDSVTTTSVPWNPGSPIVQPSLADLQRIYEGLPFDYRISSTQDTSDLTYIYEAEPLVMEAESAITLSVTWTDVFSSRDSVTQVSRLPSITTESLARGMSLAYDGTPFIEVVARSDIHSEKMKWAYNALPFVTIPFNANAITTAVNIEEAIPISESLLAFYPVSIEETINVEDELITNQVLIFENIPVLDFTLPKVIVSIEETVDAIDDVATAYFSSISGVDTVKVLDTVTFTLIQNVQEVINVREDTTATKHGILVTDYSGMQIEVAEYVSDTSTTNISIGTYESDHVGMHIPVLVYNLPDIVDATSPTNIFAPTLIINGSTIFSNVATDPGGTAANKTSVYIHWLSTGVEGNEWIDLYNFSFELDYNGGNFNIISKKPLNVTNPNPNPINASSILFSTSYFHNFNQGAYVQITDIDTVATKNLGYQATIFGLKGTILDFGPTIEDQEAGWVSSGFFGSQLLNKNMSFILYASSASALVTTTGDGSHVIQASDAMGMSFQIARICNVKLVWALPNIPVQNTLKLDGMTGLQAISSLVAQAGGTLRWNGNDEYIAAYPNQSFGKWEVPDAKLLLPSGIRYTQHLDLDTGLTGAGVLSLPRLTDGRDSALPSQQQSALPTLQQVGKLSHKLTDREPAAVFDLPYNYDRLYIQILVASGRSTSGSNNVALTNFMTTDPSQWFEFSTAILQPGIQQSDYVFTTYMGNSYVPQVKVDHNIFPNVNEPVDADEFMLSLACSTKSLSDAFNSSQDKLKAAAQNQQSAAFESSRFIKTYTGTISCQFFGSLPLPGMWGKATIPGGATVYTLDPLGNTVTNRIPLTGDMVVEGVIESVQFSYPGVVTVQVAQYARINYGNIQYINASVTGGAF